MRLKNKIALITGSSRGIGRTIALTLADEGADIIVNYNLHSEQAQDVVEQIQSMGRRALKIQANVVKSQEVNDMVLQVKDKFGRIDILVCNAGIGSRSLIHETTDEEWEQVFNVNVRGVFNVARAIVPLMRKQKYGKIVTISSVIAKRGGGLVSKSTYAASKAAVIGYTRGIALEGAEYGINANCVCPGGIEKEGMGGDRPPGFSEKSIQGIPFGRLGTPEDVASAVVFLVSDESSYVTGCTVDVNGGLLMN